MPSISPRTRFSRRVALAWCAAMLAMFGAASYLAVLGKSPTFDEPMHVIGSWVHLHAGDFRINFEDPPLWQFWCALPNGKDALKVDWTLPTWRDMPENIDRQWPFTIQTLYRTRGNDAAAITNRSRGMMMLIGIALGAVIAGWTWRIAGPVAACVATTLFALDPNFLAHASLVKNDVALTLAMTGLVWALWSVGQRLTWRNALATALFTGLGLGLKFSAVLFAPLIVLLLLIRALMRQPWDVMGKTLERRIAKLASAAALVVFIGIVSYVSIWACYGFRYDAIPGGGQRLNMAFHMEEARYNAAWRRHPTQVPRADELEQEKDSPSARAIAWANDHHLLPEPWLTGLMYVHARAAVRSTYLMGDRNLVGWWYYFPMAMLFKTPVATLAVGAAALYMGLRLSRGRWPQVGWTLLCLAIPPAYYLLIAMRSSLNIGVRHMLPMYPFLFVAAGIVAAAMWRRRRRETVIALAILGCGLAAETALIAPDFLTFFNAIVGGRSNGVRLLSDSNLDWGQDLPLLAKWQREHPDVPLYLGYFGTADPVAYGIRYLNLPESYAFGPPAVSEPDRPGAIIALSATKMQGVYGSRPIREAYQRYMNRKPKQILGGTIYLFDSGGADGATASEAPR